MRRLLHARIAETAAMASSAIDIIPTMPVFTNGCGSRPGRMEYATKARIALTHHGKRTRSSAREDLRRAIFRAFLDFDFWLFRRAANTAKFIPALAAKSDYAGKF